MSKVDDEAATKQRLRELSEEFAQTNNELKKNRCFESIRALNAFLLAVAVVVLVLIVIAWPTWYNLEVFGPPVLYMFILQIPISALNDMYAAEVLFIFILTYLGLIFYFFAVDFVNFILIFGELGNTGNIGNVCSQPYCHGWQAYVFFIYYWFIMINLVLLLAMTLLFTRLFYLDWHFKNLTNKRVQKQSVEDLIRLSVKSAYPFLQSLNSKLSPPPNDNDDNNNNNQKTD